MVRLSLEAQSPRELERTPASDPVDASTAPDGAGDVSEGCAGNRGGGAVELWRIAQLKGVCTGLQREAFPNHKCLEEGDIVLNVSRAVIGIPTHIADCGPVRNRTGAGLRAACRLSEQWPSN